MLKLAKTACRDDFAALRIPVCLIEILDLTPECFYLFSVPLSQRFFPGASRYQMDAPFRLSFNVLMSDK